MLLHRVR